MMNCYSTHNNSVSKKSCLVLGEFGRYVFHLTSDILIWLLESYNAVNLYEKLLAEWLA